MIIVELVFIHHVTKWALPMSGSPVRFRDVTKTFGSTVALKAFNLDIAAGEFVMLLGASGSGKSTALSILAGFSDATFGDVYIDGELMHGVPSEMRNVGVVFQSFALFPHMTVAETVACPLRMRRRPADEISRKVGGIGTGAPGLAGETQA